MALFTGIGDFFRGAFGEDDEEKKRRKQREAQEAAQRRAVQQKQPTAKPQSNQPSLKVSVDNQPKPKITTTSQLFQSKPTPQPKLKVATTPTQDLKVGDTTVKNTTSVRPAPRRTLPKDDKLQDAVDVLSMPGRNLIRVGTGVLQEAPGLYDLISPGHGQNRISKALDETAKALDKSAKDAGIETAYKVGNVPTEILSYFLPSKIATTAAGKLPKAAKLTEKTVDRIANSIENVEDASKMRRFLADRMRRGWTLDEAIQEALISSRYIGQGAGRGEDTSPVSVGTDVAAGVGGSLLFPGRLLRRVDDVEDTITKDVVGAGITGGAEAAESRLTRSVDDVVEKVEEKGVRNATQEELEAVVNDVDRPAIDRKPAADELKRRADEAATAAKTPVDETPSYQNKQDIENIVREVEDSLNDYLVANPNLTPAQIEAAQKAAQERALKLIEDLKAGRRAATEAVEGQGEELAANASKQADVNAEVAAARAASTSPEGNQIVEGKPVSGDPEVAANDAYTPGRTDEQVLFEGAPKFDEKGRLAVTQLFSPDRVLRENVTRPTEELVQKGISNAQTASNPISRTFGRLFSGFRSEAGKSADLLAAGRKMHGGIETGKLYRESIADLGKDLDTPSKQRVWSTLDPDRATELGIKVADDLTPEEVVYQTKLKELIDYTTQEHLRRGNITPEQAANGDYIKRAYSVFEDGSTVTQSYSQAKNGLLNQLKGRKEVNEALLEKAVTDPGYLVAKKTAESHALWAMQDYGEHLVKSGIVSDVARPGYTQLENSNIFGSAAGKFVPHNIAEEFTGFQYTSGMLNSWNDLISAYDSLGIRQAKKQLLTIFNPAVRVGNQFSNRVVFSNFNGINPIRFEAAMFKVNDMKRTGHQLYREAVEMGLTGIDITQAEFAKRIADTTDSNIARQGVEWAKKSYSAADDKARIAAYVVKREQGYSPQEAARQVQRGFQDYQSVGFFYDMAAKTPLIGNAFVRFVGDSVRIAKNAAIDHPIRSISTIALWANFVNAMSVASGESPEDKATREGRFGAPQIPFTDISLTVQSPWGEINVARFIPMYALNDIGNEATRLLPMSNSPVDVEDGKVAFDGSGFQDPLLGQVPQLIADKDFRNKSIADPDNVTFKDGTTKYDKDPLSDDEKWANRFRFLFTQNAPLGREADALLSSTGTQLANGAIGSPNEKREDIYGKSRDPGQAILRAFGIKNEQFGPEEAAEARGREAYFARNEEIEKEVAKMEPEAQAAYRRLTGQYNLREQKPNLFKPGETVDKNAPVYDWSEQKFGEYMQHPELFDLMQKRAIEESQVTNDDGKRKPLNPIFDERLPKDFRLQIVQQRSIAPGDDLELQQRMYEHPLWDTYKAIQEEYRAKAKAYYPEADNDEGFVDEMLKHQDAPFPDKPAKWKEYTDARARGEKPEWNDEYKAARTEYENAKLNWTNRERAVRGLPAIPAEQWFNSTFGYDPDADKGFGFGGGGRRNPSSQLGELTNFTGSVDRLNPIEAAAMPQLAQLFARLRAGEGGTRAKPKLGASSTGR